MRSTIDWNEIVPLLNKGLRDTLMMEAVLMLSADASKAAKESHPGKRTSSNGTGLTSKGDRSWYARGDGKTLSAVGRRYRVNKGKVGAPSRGKIGKLWEKLVESKNDVITYEGMASLCKGLNLATSTMICQLWERGHIDVEPPEQKKFALAT